jgi:hypothetical protein
MYWANKCVLDMGTPEREGFQNHRKPEEKRSSYLPAPGDEEAGN